MRFIYLADTFEDNYHILRDHFETESVNVMCRFLQRNKGNSNMLSWLSLSENHENRR